MADELPRFHYRVRPHGVQVFRVTQGRTRRTELEPVALVLPDRAEMRPRKDAQLSDAEKSEIEAWMQDRIALEAARQLDDVLRLVDQLGKTTHWAQTRAGASELDAVTDPLMLAMHDLRAILVRKRSERLSRGDG